MNSVEIPQLPLAGGCQCGAVRYRLSAPPIVFYICHCTECQKQSSSAFGQSMRVRASDLEVSGRLGERRRDARSGPVLGAFCPLCGSRVFHSRDKYGDTVNIKAGTLDDTAWLHPAGHIWTRSKQPWVALPKDGLIYSEQPPDKDAALIARWQAMLSG